MEHAQLSEFITKNFDRLSPQLRKAARFLLERPDDVAMRSMRDVAKLAGVPAATLVRLARSLNFPDYVAMRHVFQQRIREGEASRRYSLKARDLQRRAGDDKTLALMKDLFVAEMGNIEETFQHNDAKILLKAVESIEKAERIFVLGQRSCFPPAYVFNYVFQLFRPNSILLPSAVYSFVDELRRIGPNDLLIAMSISPYTRDVVRAVRYARANNARIVAITDDRLSPIAREADITLQTTTSTPSFFHSIISMIAIVQALLALLVARGGKKTLKAIEQSEMQLDWFGAYWNEKQEKS